MAVITRDEFDALTRRDFVPFIERVFADQNPTTRYIDNFHIHVLAAKLEAVRRGEIKRLIINVPPRSLKSLIASIAFVAWLLGHDPTRKIICASYGQPLADDLARSCRAIMQTPWYQRLFRFTRLDPNHQAVNAFETTAGGFRLATSVMGSLTGFGADVMVIDDPVNPDQAMSESERKRANHWFSSTVITRLNDKREGAIVVVMQRLHEDDFVGHILKLDDWHVVSFPAIAQKDEFHTVVTPFGSYTHVRREGEALHPEREPLSVLNAIRRNQGAEQFAAQYLQTPAPPGGGIIKIAWFRRYRKGDLPSKFDHIIQSWDTANKAAEVNDPSVCTTWGTKGKDIYLLDVLRVRQEYPDLKRTILSMARDHRADVVLIEDKSSGTPLLQDLKRDRLWQVKGIIPEGEKEMRMRIQSALIENGFVYIPEDAPWLAEYLHELMMFPRGLHDDQVDSTAQALQYFNEQRNEPPFLTYLRELVDAPRKQKKREERIVGVRGTTPSLYTRAKLYNVGPDGLFRIPWIDAQPLLKIPGWSIVEDDDPA